LQLHQAVDMVYKECLDRSYQEALKKTKLLQEVTSINDIILPQNISDIILPQNTFKPTGEKPQGGSSACIQFFIKKDDGSVWIGKCSGQGIGNCDGNGKIIKPNTIDEYREYISTKLYKLFGVRTPEIALSNQLLTKEAIENFEVPNANTTRVHFMSKCIDNFTIFGDKFVANYKKTPKNLRYQINGKPIRGFGRVLAVATFLYDYDCIGNSGGNMGYIIDGNDAIVVKIDAGEALPFKKCVPGTYHDPKNRDTKIGTTTSTNFHFNDLTDYDKKEFIQAVFDILEHKNEELENIFAELSNHDKKFIQLKNHLLERKSKFLSAFSPEVREIIEDEIKRLQKEKGEKVAQNFYEESLGSTLFAEKKLMETEIELNRHSGDITKFQLKQVTKNFVGRTKEFATLSESFKSNNFCYISGAAGQGKTTFATKYALDSLNKKIYGNIVWLDSEFIKDGLLASQIKNYMQIVYDTFMQKDKKQKFFKNPSGISNYEVIPEFYNYLNTLSQINKSKVCIVFDNVEVFEPLKNFLPSAKNKNVDILITTRYADLIPNSPNINLRISELSAQEVMDYFEKRGVSKAQMQNNCNRLYNLLGGLPLALEQAAAYIEKTKITVEEYCTQFEKERLSLLDESNKDYTNHVSFCRFK